MNLVFSLSSSFQGKKAGKKKKENNSSDNNCYFYFFFSFFQWSSKISKKKTTDWTLLDLLRRKEGEQKQKQNEPDWRKKNLNSHRAQHNEIS